MVFVEFRELCRYAQNYKGDFMFYDKYVFLCKRKGVSPSRAAEEAGFAKSLVSKWRVNKTDVPSADILSKISAYFMIPVSELLGEDIKKEQPTVIDDGLSEKQKAFIFKVMQMSDAELDRVEKVLSLVENKD
jgi:transcriptional regulator with XRE-family HTH domain